MSGIRHRPPEESVPSDAVRAQAAAWIARLHDDQRSPDLEADLRGWLEECEDHRRAFDRMMWVWELTGKIQMRARGLTPIAARHRRLAPWAATLAAGVILVVAGTVYYYGRDNVLVTGVGQQQVRLLPDGTRVSLNTDTRIEVNYDERARRVRLIHGEAWFDVSKRPTWPFLVSVDGQEIRALGTSFIVRHDDIQDLSVTLVEGRISVSSISRGDETPQAPEILVPGQRLVISRYQSPAVDRPELTHISAWKRGRVDFEDTPLRDAAHEMNRYSTRHVTIADAEAARQCIGGNFRAGDTDEFVRVVTAAFGLRADRRGDDIVLSKSAGPHPLRSPPCPPSGM
jgi:transmembrane sensor